MPESLHKYDLRERGRPDSASRALILLHGRGASAENILPLADFFAGDNWYVVAPQATNFQWYPYSFLMPASQNEPWLGSAIDYIKKIIDHTTRYLPSQNIYLMGFSQGACLSAEFAARFAVKYGGIAVFTGGLIGETLDPGLYKGDFQGTRVYISNGEDDPHIPVSRSEETREHLERLGARVRLEIFPGREHTVTHQEIVNAREFILGNGKPEK
jgi:phospholipase/carboxylesterase